MREADQEDKATSNKEDKDISTQRCRINLYLKEEEALSSSNNINNKIIDYINKLGTLTSYLYLQR